MTASVTQNRREQAKRKKKTRTASGLFREGYYEMKLLLN